LRPSSSFSGPLGDCKHLSAGVDVNAANLDRLLAAPLQPFKRLHEFDLQPDKLVRVGAVHVDVIFGHQRHALRQKAKPGKACGDNFYDNKRLEFRLTICRVQYCECGIEGFLFELVIWVGL
jgi:hypothetical protein